MSTDPRSCVCKPTTSTFDVSHRDPCCPYYVDEGGRRWASVSDVVRLQAEVERLHADREAALSLMDAVGRFLERGNPTEAAGNGDMLKAAYFTAQVALIRTNNA